MTPEVSALGHYALGRVHQGEALAHLTKVPSDSVDMVVTDMPYSSGGFTRSDRNQDASAKYERSDVAAPRASFTGDNRDARSWTYWCQLWLSECLRIVKEGGYALIFTDWRQLPCATDAFQAGGFVWRGVVAWDKGEGARAPHTGYFRHQAEYVVWGTRGPLAPCSHGGPFPGVLRYPVRQDDKFHLTGKPTELMRALVKPAPKGGIVLDPFAGSGTTLVACELEGRVGLGFELEAANVLTANERIEAARVSLDAQAARAGQRPLFDTPAGAHRVRVPTCEAPDSPSTEELGRAAGVREVGAGAPASRLDEEPGTGGDAGPTRPRSAWFEGDVGLPGGPGWG